LWNAQRKRPVHSGTWTYRPTEFRTFFAAARFCDRFDIWCRGEMEKKNVCGSLLILKFHALVLFQRFVRLLRLTTFKAWTLSATAHASQA